MTEHRADSIRLVRLDPSGDDREALVLFLTTEDFPFHVTRTVSRAEADRRIDSGSFRDDDHDSFWLHHDTHGKIGIVVLEDLADPVPLVDLRLAGSFRGLGLGVPALRSVTDHVFRTLPGVTRIEGQTRDDNTAMRRVFLGAGWVKEAHYREAWPVPGGSPRASVAYGVLRRDWETGTITPVRWDDAP